MFRRSCCCLALLLLACVINVSAQPGRYSSQSRAAIKKYEEGLHYYDVKQYDQASSALQDAVKKDTSFIEAYILLASVLEDQGKLADAAENYRRSFAVKPDFFPLNYFRCGRLELKTCQYREAEGHFQKFLSYQNQSPERRKQAEKFAEDCRFAIHAMEHPVPFNPVNLGSGVNSSDGEYYFSFTVDQQMMIFTRDVRDASAAFGHQEDFYKSKWVDSSWNKAVNAGAPLNTDDNEGAPGLSADGRLLFFAACNRQSGEGSCDIYLAQQNNDGSWTKPVNPGPPLNTSAFESQPSFSSDGVTLYFTKGVRSEGIQHTDIYYSVFQKDMHWSVPLPVKELNTKGNEQSVYIHPDNQTIYFSSDGHTGMGGLDVFVSRKDSAGKWSKPENLGYPINTCNDEKSFVVSADGSKSVFLKRQGRRVWRT
jgi:tetratricopeptide (TPR) repeat protein